MAICIVVGTRPEIIKMSPVIRACEKQDLDYFVVHTGQHYSYEMDRVFFEDFNLSDATYKLDVGSANHGRQTGLILEKLEEILLKDSPEIVLIEGDTNSVLAGALAAAKLHVRVGHIEAGLRSYDRSMPEEINRVLTDHVSDLLFAPTKESKSNLLKEGISEEKIYVTGNTIVDAVFQNLGIADKKVDTLKEVNLSKGKYILVTVHREENVDDRIKLENMFEGFSLVHQEFGFPLVFPIHPRAKKMVEKFGLVMPEGVTIMEPVGFLEFLQLEANSRMVLTDSGGVQEESCILNVPCVTLRENTERPETIAIGSNILAGTDPKKIIESVHVMLDRKRDWSNPFGDGKAGGRIVDIISKK